MKFTYTDQAYFAKIALVLIDQHRSDVKKLNQLLSVGEMIKQNTTEENGIIFDITEYIYQAILLQEKDPRAFEDIQQRKNLEASIQELTND